MTRRLLMLMAAGAAAATLLGGCGDSPSAELPPPLVQAKDQVPPSATATTAAFVDFARSLSPSDSGEPLKLGNVMPPTSETEEPRRL